ncbi:DivIVA domain-containing protein [Actinomadura rupiterrae]|uniref:DivIVA domain-containing protein n=1 Tax=Actinomadura rupiterrae TaxID=559627 RepID=UPI0020A386AA|nr:DivIVA domain-containing protein [Actinomadura rupiterrae]MCP2339729.1 DivIVA domain-containing protein [Actinomadura rupiterrae]
MNPAHPPLAQGGPRLTPGEVQAAVFQRAALGRRGLDEDQVREFLQRVEQELVQLLNERAALGQEVDRLRAAPAEAGAGDAARPDDAHFQAVRILSQAQQTADLYVADAERYTRELAQEARQHRDAILTDAQSRADRMMEEAHQRAAAMADQAARSVAPAAEPPAQPASAPDLEETRADGLAPLDADERRRMEREIAYLRTYSDVYRTHLRAYLEALLRNVDEWERSEKENPEKRP